MKRLLIISAFALLGGLVGGIVRLITYQFYKGTIEFDGPAGLSFLLAFAGGAILFAVIGTVFTPKNKF